MGLWARFIALALIWALPVLAEVPDCPGYFARLRTVADEAGENFITAADQQAIDTVFADRALSPRERATSAFRIALEARLRKLPADEAAVVREIYRKAEITYSQGAYNGNFWFGKAQVQMHPDFAGTMLEMYTLGHELEHAIQQTKVFKNYSGAKNLAARLAAFYKVRYLQELGAMRAEWNYLQAFPVAERRAMAAEVEKNEKLPAGAKAYLVRCLNSSEKDMEAYIRDQHQAGRYSRSRLMLEQASLTLSPLAIMYGMYSYSRMAACQAMDDDYYRTGHRSEYFQKFCR